VVETGASDLADVPLRGDYIVDVNAKVMNGMHWLDRWRIYSVLWLVGLPYGAISYSHGAKSYIEAITVAPYGDQSSCMVPATMI